MSGKRANGAAQCDRSTVPEGSLREIQRGGRRSRPSNSPAPDEVCHVDGTEPAGEVITGGRGMPIGEAVRLEHCRAQVLAYRHWLIHALAVLVASEARHRIGAQRDV